MLANQSGPNLAFDSKVLSKRLSKPFSKNFESKVSSVQNRLDELVVCSRS